MPSLKKILLILISVLSILHCSATHNRAGEITYRHVEGYTFEFTITTYTFRLSAANRNVLTVNWGDGTSQEVPLTGTPETLPNNYLKNTYIAEHTYPGTGVYEILMEDPNRNLGVKNIPNSVNTIFSIKTTMLIAPFTGTNSTPVLMNPPVDNAARGHLFTHNPAAYDPDGDSISYELTVCTAEFGNPIDAYSLPPASDTLKLDPVTGDLIWDTPVDTGVYNIAMYVDEWRDGVRIGRIARDMQIDVYETDNRPPVNSPIQNYCVEAGDTVEFEFTVTDPDGDPIQVAMTGAPFIDTTASYEYIEISPGFVRVKFTWITNCSHAQNQPHTIVIKSQDNVSNDISLVDISSFFIRVLHNSPENILLSPGTDTIQISWDRTDCDIASGYRIYRKIGTSGFVPDSCENGVPAYTGFELLDEVMGYSSTIYTDDNHGFGLVPGFDYCYIITAIYFDGAESFASSEVCTTLISGTPPILQVSVLKNDAETGEILVSWAVPIGVDTLDDGPFRYEVYRKIEDEPEYIKLATIPTVDLTDTTFLDTNINTLIYPYFYSVRVSYKDDNGIWQEVPGYETASSLYLNLFGADNQITVEMAKRSPWLNYQYDVFRRNEAEINFDSIGTTNASAYIDRNLANKVPFTYKVKSYGVRPLFESDYYTINLSHINTGEAIDTVPPCPPHLEVESFCDSAYNQLTWTSPLSVCGSDDVVEYQIYYRPTLEGEFQLLATQNPFDTTYRHDENLESLAAVYGVAAIDSFANASELAIAIIDTCQLFGLANVFSPNGDGVNDIYTSLNEGGFVKNVNMKIYNRHGVLVFSTTNADINWDGYNIVTKQLVSSGVYYYICDVYEPRISGLVHKTLKGFIHVFSGDSNPRSE